MAEQIVFLPIKQTVILSNQNNEILLLQDQLRNRSIPSSFIKKNETWNTNLQKLFSEELGLPEFLMPHPFHINIEKTAQNAPYYHVLFSGKLPQNYTLQKAHEWGSQEDFFRILSKKISFYPSDELFANITQSAVIQRPDKKTLILSLPDGKWHFPGGRINKGEDCQNSLKREIFEETKIANFAIQSILGVENWVLRSSKNPCYAVFFSCTIPEVSNITISNEHKDFAWVDYQTNLSLFDFYNPRMKEILEDLLRPQTISKDLSTDYTLRAMSPFFHDSML